MRVAVLYRSGTDYESSVLEFSREFNRRTGRSLELMDVETVEGDYLATLYDVTRYPSVLALDNEGKVLASWSDQLPLINELTYYTIDS